MPLRAARTKSGMVNNVRMGITSSADPTAHFSGAEIQRTPDTTIATMNRNTAIGCHENGRRATGGAGRRRVAPYGGSAVIGRVCALVDATDASSSSARHRVLDRRRREQIRGGGF